MSYYKNSLMNKRIIPILVSIWVCLSPVFSVLCLGEGVSEREILLLAIMSYKNNQKENTWENTNDEEFNLKWFGGCTDASELNDWKMVDCIINENLRNMDGFSVVTYKKGNNVVIAFRGTDSGIINENIKYIIPKKEHPQVKYLLQYIDSLKYKPFIKHNTKIYITGHSLGGYLATYALGKSLKMDELKNKIVKVITFNALGLGYIADKSIEDQLSKVNENILINYAIKGDIVSKIGKHFTKLIYLNCLKPRSSKTPIIVSGNPHFPYNFLDQDLFLKTS